MLYFWIIYALALLAYSAKLAAPAVVHQGMAHLSAHQQVPSYVHLFALLLKHMLRLLPQTLLRPIPFIIGFGGLGLQVYLAFQH